MDAGRQGLIIQYVLGELEGATLRKVERMVRSEVEARGFALQTSEILGAVGLAYAMAAPPDLAERVLSLERFRSAGGF